MSDPEQGRPVISGVARDAFFVIQKPQEPDIPVDKARRCPQCGKQAWALSRWCWHCRYDFDRASLARFHPVKLLALSLLANVLLGAALVIALAD